MDGAQAGEVSAYDLTTVVQALTGEPFNITDTDTVEHHGTERPPHDTDLSTSSAPPNEHRHRK
ncbi:hypothetical protein ACLBYD_29515 [Rhodococcus sp. C26F]